MANDNVINMCKAFDTSVEEAVLKIMESFNLTKQEANKIVKMTDLFLRHSRQAVPLLINISD